jgi:hypothetical protein
MLVRYIYLSMPRNNSDSKCSVHVYPEDMRNRTFRYSTGEALAQVLHRAHTIAEADPSLLRPLTQAHPPEITMRVKDPNDWMSSSMGEPGVERYTFVYKKLAK